MADEWRRTDLSRGVRFDRGDTRVERWPGHAAARGPDAADAAAFAADNPEFAGAAPVAAVVAAVDAPVRSWRAGRRTEVVVETGPESVVRARLGGGGVRRATHEFGPPPSAFDADVSVAVPRAERVDQSPVDPGALPAVPDALDDAPAWVGTRAYRRGPRVGGEATDRLVTGPVPDDPPWLTDDPAAWCPWPGQAATPDALGDATRVDPAAEGVRGRLVAAVEGRLTDAVAPDDDRDGDTDPHESGRERR